MSEFEALVEWYWQGETELLGGGRGIQLPGCRPQIQYGRTWDGKELKGYSPATNPLYV
jgi:hypothetical protein